MAGIFNDDDSTDDEIGVNLQLAERLRIHRGDNNSAGDGKKFENSKDFKQFYNLRRKKSAQDGRSSSSSSDNPLSGIMSSDIYPNKKRQNGDKNVDQLANPKRTCLSDRYCKLSDCQYLKKKNSNGYQCEQSKFLEPFHLQSSDLFHSKKNEDQINNLADSEDSDFEIPKLSRNGKKGSNHCLKTCKNQSPLLRTSRFQNLDESAPSTSYINNFFESGSDEESKGICKTGALKGGRQEPSNSTHYAKRLFGRKVNKKVLDSDESEEDKWQSCYRSTKPLVYSSSDSDDFSKSNDKNKHTSNDTTSNGSSSQSLSCDGLESTSLRLPKQYKSIRPNQKFSKKSASPMPPLRADSSDSCDRQFLSSDFQRKNTANRPCRARRSARINMAANLTQNVFTCSGPVSNAVRGRRLGGGERGTRRSGSPHHRNIRSQYYKDHEGKCNRGRSVSASRPQTEMSNFTSRYPELFDAEESDNEFFTANSYSDTETSTESLGGLTSNGTFSNYRSQVPCINCDENPYEDASTDDEISVVFSSAPRGRNSEARRGASRTLGRRYNRGGTPHRQLQNTEIISLSPDPVEQVRQVEEDERIARMLQEQFDAELDPDFTPINHDVILSHEDSDDDDDIIDPVTNDSDSDDGRRYPSYATLSRRTTYRPRFPNRPGTPNAISAAIFFSPRRNDRTRRRFQLSREPRSDWLFEFGLTVPAIFDGEDDYESLLSLDLNGEVVPRGLQKTQINRLPTRTYINPNSSGSSEVAHKRAELNKECQVCLTDYETGDVLRILPCFHEFHTPCIDPWLKINHTCPVCRVSVDLDA